jgi:hypothetical protein
LGLFEVKVGNTVLLQVEGLQVALISIQGLATVVRTSLQTSVMTQRPASRMWGVHAISHGAENLQNHVINL